jgi:hypothetical protein
MYLIFSIVCVIIGTNIWYGSLLDIPLAQLTLRMILSNLASVAFLIGALWLLGESLKEDRVWPWRWTLAYLGNSLIKTGFVVAFSYGALYINNQTQNKFLSWAIIILVGLAILGILMSPKEEFEIFKEKSSSKDKDEEIT